MPKSLQLQTACRVTAGAQLCKGTVCPLSCCAPLKLCLHAWPPLPYSLTHTSYLSPEVALTLTLTIIADHSMYAHTSHCSTAASPSPS